MFSFIFYNGHNRYITVFAVLVLIYGFNNWLAVLHTVLVCKVLVLKLETCSLSLGLAMALGIMVLIASLVQTRQTIR